LASEALEATASTAAIAAIVHFMIVRTGSHSPVA